MATAAPAEASTALGEGGEGSVALHVSDGIPVARKTITHPCGSLCSDARGMERAWSCRHCVRMHSVGDGMRRVDMQVAWGDTMTVLMQCDEPQWSPQLHQWAVQLCTAVDDMHHVGMVHGDIKPENMLLVGGEDSPSTAEERLALRADVKAGTPPAHARAASGQQPPPPDDFMRECAEGAIMRNAEEHSLQAYHSAYGELQKQALHACTEALAGRRGATPLRVCVADFGLCSLSMDRSRDAAVVTRMHTPMYACPELMTRGAAIGGGSATMDTWAVAVTLVGMASGRRLWAAAVGGDADFKAFVYTYYPDQVKHMDSMQPDQGWRVSTPSVFRPPNVPEWLWRVAVMCLHPHGCSRPGMPWVLREIQTQGQGVRAHGSSEGTK